jgi:hypothetical protein
MYALKAIATREGCVPDSTAPDFSQTFVDNIHSYGRSFVLAAGLSAHELAGSRAARTAALAEDALTVTR